MTVYQSLMRANDSCHVLDWTDDEFVFNFFYLARMHAELVDEIPFVCLMCGKYDFFFSLPPGSFIFRLSRVHI